MAALRNREAAVAARAAQKQAELDQAQARLDYLKQRLRLAIKILEQRLVAIYESNEPDLITVLLQAHGFDDLLARTQYLETLQHQDNDIVARVRGLRNEMQVTVNTVRAARDEIAARKHGARCHRREAQAADHGARHRAAQAARHAEKVRKQQDDLEGDLSDISQKIAEQLGAGTGALPAGPIRAGGAWPDLAGQRADHLGLRTAQHRPRLRVPPRSRHRGAHRDADPRRRRRHRHDRGADGGYGNYTCIDHGGGLSTCYGHQERFLVSAGQQVAQGQIIGLSDCTGYCFGPHVHFEVRINGQTTDPLGYL